MSHRERTAAAALLGPEHDLDDLIFTWGTTLAVGSCAQILDVVEVSDADEGTTVGYVVFDPTGGVLTAFTQPESL